MTNVLIYIIDALRADHLSCYGHRRPTSPHLDALATDPLAVRFSRAFSPSTWTKPVAASILSGCYAPAHGVRTRNDLFTRAVPRLSALLQSAGYRTFGVSTIGNVSSSLGFAAGFDRFVDLYKEASLASRRRVSNTGAWKLYFEEDTTVVLPLAEDVNEFALAWLNEQVNPSPAPWFMFLWALDPHDPYYPPPGFDRWNDPGYRGRIDGSAESVRRVRNRADVQRLVDLYDGEIAYTDEQFGRLIARLRELGLYDDTLIVVAGDHGEAFGEHGDFVHGHLAYEEVMHVPLIIKLPAGARPDATERTSGQAGARAFPAALPAISAGPGVSTALAQLTDIAPTVLDALGLSALAAGMQGYSLLPAIRAAGWQQAESPPLRSVAYAETQSSNANQRLLAVRSERWKYLRVDPPADYGAEPAGPARAVSRSQRLAGYWQQLSNPDMVKKALRNPLFYLRRQLVEREMLFDLEADPREQRNVIAAQPEVAVEMRAALEAWLAECRVYAGLSHQRGADLGLDEATRKQLEGLGYL